METLHRLLERLGFVRLRDYGLLLTADRRVLTTRKAILDDGYGGCVVGWADGDLATMELATWGAPRPPPPKVLPKPPRRSIAAPKPVVAETAPPEPIVAPEPVAPEPVAPEPVAPPPEPIAPPVAAVEPEPPVEEDEWEWEIAMARARAAADQAVAAADAVLARQPIARIARIVREPLPLPTPRANDDSRPPTIIPVPSLPSIDPRLVRSYEAPRRFPRATAQRAAVPPPSRSARR